MSKPDGGPAFPTQWQNDGDMNNSAPNGQVLPPGGIAFLPGLSVRDYFAVRAMGWAIRICTTKEKETDMALAANIAYGMADEMIKERAK